MKYEKYLEKVDSKYPKFKEKGALFLYAIDNGILSMIKEDSSLLDELIATEVIVERDGKFVINDSEDIDYIKEYRNLWKGTGKMGDINTVTKKMRMFSNEYNLLSSEIVDLARYYVENFQAISGILQGANYFLYKEQLIRGKKITTSRAASLLDEQRNSANFKQVI